MAASALTALAERITAGLCGSHEALRVALLHLLAEGRPVSPGLLANHLRWSAKRVTSIVQGCPDTEFDQSGQIVGWGYRCCLPPISFVSVNGRSSPGARWTH